jgi:hypothetical protein
MKQKRFLLMEMLKNSSKTGNVFLLLAAVVMCFCMTNGVMAQEVASGKTGSCTWTLTGTSDNYTLTISGNGAMGNYSDNSNSPWYSYQIGIKTVDIQQGVTSIANFAFFGCRGLISVAIPNSVTSIGDYAFINCSSLISVSIPNSVTEIKMFAFEGCNSLTSIMIPHSVKSIGSLAFSYCRSLTSITVDASNPAYSSTDGVLFNKLQNILILYPAGKAENYTIPNSVTAIGKYAFEGCSGLISVTIPNSVTSIGNDAFSGCRGLTSVTIPNSVTSIGSYAFRNCIGLTSVTIGNSVKSIEYNAFFDCSGLTSVTNLSQNPQTIDSYTFYSVNINNATLYVPVESVEAYKAASVWQNFGTITAYTPSAINAPSITNAIRVYPNPVTESFCIDGITVPTQVTVTDISGKTVLQQTVAGDESISVGHLPQGIYLVRVNGKTVKIIKSL